jgi:hypothetical protein
MSIVVTGVARCAILPDATAPQFRTTPDPEAFEAALLLPHEAVDQKRISVRALLVESL